MIRRVFWFSVGAGAALYVASKVRNTLHAATPRAITHRVSETAVGVTDSFRDFSDRVRAAMAEREEELRDALGLTD